MNARPSLVQWIVLAAAGGASFYGASHLAAPDAAEDATESLVREASAQPSPAIEAAVAAPATAPAVAPSARALIEVGNAADAFSGRSWNPPPPPPPPAPVEAVRPPPPPSAPPLPYRFIGMLEQKSDQPAAFLAKGEALHVVKVGDVIDEAYRIESLSPAKVVITYLPLKQQQTLSVEGGQP